MQNHLRIFKILYMLIFHYNIKIIINSKPNLPNNHKLHIYPA